MQRGRGFTIIELIVVIVVIVILLTLTTVSVAKNQANARDAKRQADIKIIASGLETRYKEGNPIVTAPSYVAPGSYPGVNEMLHIIGNLETGFTPAQIFDGYVSDALPGTSTSNFNPPDHTGDDFTDFKLSCTSSCGAALDDAAMEAKVTKDTYYYQPINAAGNVCMQGDCVRFILYWRSEVSGDMQKLESKHQ